MNEKFQGNDLLTDQVEDHEVIEVGEDVVGQQSDAIVGQIEGNEIGHDGQRSRVQVIDLIMRNVQVDERWRDGGQGGCRQPRQVIVSQVERVERCVVQDSFGQDAKSIGWQVDDPQLTQVGQETERHEINSIVTQIDHLQLIGAAESRFVQRLHVIVAQV